MLAVLAVMALSLLPGVNVGVCVTGEGRRRGRGSTGSSFCLLANENVRPAFLIDQPLERGVGGTGISWNGRCVDTIELVCESFEISVDEGIVDEELKRAEDAALPYGAVEAELFVPPLPLHEDISQ